MKRIFLLFVCAFNCSLLFSQTLFTYGNSSVDKEEFLRAYNKNKTAVDNKETALKDYLELYTKFKLKVKAAKDAKLDTLPQLQNDLQNFRSQIEETYLNNEDALNQLVNEAFVRAQKDLHVIHFFVPVDANAAPADTIKAAKAIQEIYSGLTPGNKDYNALAAAVGNKYIVAARYSDLGFITVFSVPYEYENLIYGIKAGEASKPYRAKNGWHVFKVIEERKGVGKWRVAQILLAVPPGGDAGINSRSIEQRADSIYKQLQAGADFEELAKKYSDDKLTYTTGGVMPEFSVGKYEQTFEQEVFKLTKDGEISKPFPTQYGFHIVKRLGNTPVQTVKTDAVYMYDLKQKVLQDSRVSIAKDIFTRSVEKLVGYKRNVAVKDAELFRYADSVVANPALNGARQFPVSNKIIFSSSKENIKGAEWLNFVREYKTNPEIYKGESNTALLQKFITLKSNRLL
ncbi:peptidylprolyl isomerase [Ferruginibacter sp.]